MEKQNKKILIILLKNILLIAFTGLMIIYEISFLPNKLSASELFTTNNKIANCKLTTNCIYQKWEVDDPEKAFNELIQILENTPRLKIIKKEKNYIYAIATSRIMKFIDDIEIKILHQDNIFQVKSSSRIGIYDLGVNKRRVQTLRFRLIDIYG